MVKKILLTMIVLSGVMAVPRQAMAGCTTTFGNCMEAAAKVDSFWYRWAAGIDCELDLVECVRVKLIGV